MDNIDKFNECYEYTSYIIDLYDKLASLILIKNKNEDDLKNIELLLREIKEKINIENKLYSCLNVDDINEFVNIIHMKDNDELKFADIRVNSKLAIIYDKLLGNIVLNNDLIVDMDEEFNFSIIDLISSKMIIDVYKLIDSKMDDIYVSDNKSIDYFDKIRDLNIQYLVYKLSLYEVSSLLGLEYAYDIKKIPFISDDSFDIILNGNFKQVINYKVFRFLLSKINEFKNLTIKDDDYGNIYDNLLYVSLFEYLIHYLNKQQLEFVYAYFSRINSNNKIISNKIKKLVRSQINGL